MTGCDDRLQSLRKAADGRMAAQSALDVLFEARESLDKQVVALEIRRRDRQIDVDRLQSRTVHALLYQLLGKKETLLARARQDLDETIALHEAARQRLDALNAQIAARQAALTEMKQAQAEYDRLLGEKEARLLRQNGAAAREIQAYRKKIAVLTRQERDLNEALKAGRETQQLAGNALKALSSAKEWSEADIHMDGGLFRLAKNNALGQARTQIINLQAKIRDFQAELKRVGMQIDAELDAGDWFYRKGYRYNSIFIARSSAKYVGNERKNLEALCGRIGKCIEEMERQRAIVRRKADSQRYQLSSCIHHTKE